MGIFFKSTSLQRLLLAHFLCCGSSPLAYAAEAVVQRQLVFTSQGKTGMVNSDGSGLKFFEFDVPNQATWQPGPMFSDARRIVFLSMEPRRDGPGKPFEEYYTQTPTHLWIHDLASGSLRELCTKDRIAPFETPALLVGDDRLLVQVVKTLSERLRRANQGRWQKARFYVKDAGFGGSQNNGTDFRFCNRGDDLLIRAVRVRRVAP